MTAHAGHQVRIDRDGFERALANIIDNALRHTPREGWSRSPAAQDADNAFVRVLDDGPGIPSDLLPRPSEPTAVPSARNTRNSGGGPRTHYRRPPAPKPGRHDRGGKRNRRGAIVTLRLPRKVV